MYSYKNIFILGSGFSKAFCPTMPLIASLCTKLFGDKAIDNYLDLQTFSKELFKLSNGYDKFSNLETLATLILSQKVFLNEQEYHLMGKVKQQLLRFIFDEIKGNYINDKANLEILGNFILILNSPHDRGNEYSDNLLVTFNYDLLVEKTIQRSKTLRDLVHTEYGVDLCTYPSFIIQDSFATPFQYLKLHGSFNWYKAKGDNSNSNDMHNIYMVDEQDECYSIHKEDIPVYIPMAHSKEAFLNGTLFSSIWAKFGNYLDCCENVFCLGYGFPESDLFIINAMLRHKNKIKAIIVNDNESFKKVDAMFPGVVIKDDAKAFIKKEINDRDGKYHWLDKRSPEELLANTLNFEFKG
jgi:hypothetical protein